MHKKTLETKPKSNDKNDNNNSNTNNNNNNITNNNTNNNNNNQNNKNKNSKTYTTSDVVTNGGCQQNNTCDNTNNDINIHDGNAGGMKNRAINGEEKQEKAVEGIENEEISRIYNDKGKFCNNNDRNLNGLKSIRTSSYVNTLKNNKSNNYERKTK